MSGIERYVHAYKYTVVIININTHIAIIWKGYIQGETIKNNYLLLCIYLFFSYNICGH